MKISANVAKKYSFYMSKNNMSIILLK